MMTGLARLMDQTRGMVYALLLARNLISVEITYLDWNAFFFAIRLNMCIVWMTRVLILNLIDVPWFGRRLIGVET